MSTTHTCMCPCPHPCSSAALYRLCVQGFAETKHCRTEQQRQEHGVGLAFVACARDSGMIARIGRRLKLHWGTRSKKPGEEKGRPFAFDQAIDRRAKFNADVELQSKPLEPGMCPLRVCSAVEFLVNLAVLDLNSAVLC